MGNFKDNHRNESIQKLKELVQDVKICMFCTELGQLPISARPMSCNQVDDHGNLWFISNAKRNKNFEIAQDDKVQLFFSLIVLFHSCKVKPPVPLPPAVQTF